MALREKGAPLRPEEASKAECSASLSPGLWCIPARLNHEAWASFDVAVKAEDAMDTIEAAVASLMERGPPRHSSIMQVKSRKQMASTWKIVIWAFTARGWLDVVVLQASASSSGQTTRIRAHSYSTGLFPLMVKNAVVWNVLCCCAPFLGVNSTRLAMLKAAIVEQASSNSAPSAAQSGGACNTESMKRA